MNKIAQMPIGLIVKKKQFQPQYFPLKPTVFDNLILQFAKAQFTTTFIQF